LEDLSRDYQTRPKMSIMAYLVMDVDDDNDDGDDDDDDKE
jgi:hypothetical protein